jgi:hypothetical protein
VKLSQGDEEKSIIGVTVGLITYDERGLSEGDVTGEVGTLLGGGRKWANDLVAGAEGCQCIEIPRDVLEYALRRCQIPKAPELQTLEMPCQTLNPEHKTIDPQPSTLNPKPWTLNLNSVQTAHCHFQDADDCRQYFKPAGKHPPSLSISHPSSINRIRIFYE